MTSRTSPTAPSWLCHDGTVSPGPRRHSCKSAMDEAYTDDDDTKTCHCVKVKTGHGGGAKLVTVVKQRLVTGYSGPRGRATQYWTGPSRAGPAGRPEAGSRRAARAVKKFRFFIIYQNPIDFLDSFFQLFRRPNDLRVPALGPSLRIQIRNTIIYLFINLFMFSFMY